MGAGLFCVRYNVMDINSIDAFTNIRGGMNQSCKDVYFLRMIGVSAQYEKQIQQLDQVLTKRTQMGNCMYSRINSLPKLNDVEMIQEYISYYDTWQKSGRAEGCIKLSKESREIASVLGEVFCNTYNQLQQMNPNMNTTIEKNFMIKVMYWLDQIGEHLLQYWSLQKCYKFVYSGPITRHEYLFCHMLTQLGVDVMLLLPKGDIDRGWDPMQWCKKVEIGAVRDFEIPEYTPDRWHKDTPKGVSKQAVEEKVQPQKVYTRIPERDRRTQEEKQIVNLKREQEKKQKQNSNKESKQFEEIAQLASSVVMIAIHDQQGDIIGTGSGIVIGREGYILTNNHVASGGRFYSIKIEEDEEVYTTDQVIKYHSVLDLAVIRITKQLTPLPIYKGKEKLVRGQKVVAIGSPLGFFNSVSDGIIAGFREIGGVDMIQFTAPISHGSSGGAVLNMYGEVIGISTAGMDNGQNINLAVGHEYIQQFAKGFIDRID